MHIAPPSARTRSVFVSKENLLELARFCDEPAHAVSFYFSLASTPDNSHREEAIAIKRLVQQAQDNFAPQPVPTPLAIDLKEISTVAEEIRLNPGRLRAVFACSEKKIWLEFDLPAPGSIRHLNVARRFHLAPLMAAMQSCAPYCVVLLESGKARAFVVRGTEIQEYPGRLKSEDLSLHAEDSRVGWSKRVEGNVEKHEKTYFKSLAQPLLDFMAEQHTSHLVVGCREDLWGEVGPQFVFQKGTFVGHFHLPSFAIGTGEVLRMTTPIFQETLRQRCLALLDEINEHPPHAAVGVGDVLQKLGEGRVQKLILGKLPNQAISECQDCGRMWAEAGHNCIFCSSAGVRYMAAEEGLIRQALFSDAEILMVEADSVPGFSGAAALLRY
ncbi:MAG: baeRF10 domain-containing protein [Candidatus Angelobacter sp.]